MPALRPVGIRGGHEEDLPELVRLERESFSHDPYPYFVLRQFVSAFSSHLLVLDAGTHLCGYVQTTPPDDGRSWVLSLCVTPGMRRRGFGRGLMSDSLATLRAAGGHNVSLTVEPANVPALLLYKSLGFTQVGDGPRPDYFGPGEDRLLMTLAL
jgi:[ribosomal protein S18]-alanine N-acetyltransferase